MNQSQGSSGLLCERNLSFLMTKIMESMSGGGGGGWGGAGRFDNSPTLPAV